MELENGCRSEYGPLELRISATASLSGFMVYVEDSRLEHKVVHEHHAQSTLDEAKASAVVGADAYLAGRNEASSCEADWRCS